MKRTLVRVEARHPVLQVMMHLLVGVSILCLLNGAERIGLPAKVYTDMQ